MQGAFLSEIRFSKAANAQGLSADLRQTSVQTPSSLPTFRLSVRSFFPSGIFCMRKFKSAGVSLPNWPFIRHFCSTDVRGATPIFLSWPLLFTLSVSRCALTRPPHQPPQPTQQHHPPSTMKLFLYFPTAQFTNGRATDRPSFEPGTCQSDRWYSGLMGQQRTMAYNGLRGSTPYVHGPFAD